MRVLLLTYYYPPDKAVGGQRARKVADALRSAGHSVTVIAAGDAASDDESHHRVRPFISIRQLHARLKRRYASRTSPAGPAIETPTNEKPHRPRDVARWKRWIFSLIWLPDDKQGFILPAVRKPLGLPGGRPDLVYTTAPPFSVHLAGLILRALTGARWVAEFRDPWTTNPLKPDELRSAFSDWLERKLEWLCLETADLLIPVSDGIAGRLAETGTGTPLTIVR
ncbi:MAG: glycosyltransferase, partial [Gemmatimonadota bacterium]